MIKILYLSLTGMGESLGKSQVLEYLYDLSLNNEIHLISFERNEDKPELKRLSERIKKSNIKWHYFFYSNKYGIFSTIIQLLKGVIRGAHIIRNNKIDILHARSMIPALMCSILKFLYKTKLLFDIRDFSTDEKVDRNRIKKGSVLYFFLKKLEIMLYRYSDYIVTLTFVSKNILIDMYTLSPQLIEVIPTCANKELFKIISKEESNNLKKELGFNLKDKIILHSGSVTGWYLFEKEVELISKMIEIDKNIKFVVLNKGEHDFIRNIFEKYSIKIDSYFINSVRFEEMYKYINISDASLYFIKPTFSKKAAAPTKFAELVACHIPSITNSGIGDMEMYIQKYNVGTLVDFNNINIDETMKCLNILNKTENRFYDELFNKYFDKKLAVKMYNEIYKKLT